VAVTRGNSGGCWFSRPGELVSPKRDYQRLAQDSVAQLSPRRLAFLFLAKCALAWVARRDSPERDPTESYVPLSRSRLGEMEMTGF